MVVEKWCQILGEPLATSKPNEKIRASVKVLTPWRSLSLEENSCSHYLLTEDGLGLSRWLLLASNRVNTLWARKPSKSGEWLRDPATKLSSANVG